MTEGPAFGTELGRFARTVGHGPDSQILIMETVSDEVREMAREAIDHAAKERGLRVAEVCWNPIADVDGLERLIVMAAADTGLIYLSGVSDWPTYEWWQGPSIRRNRLAGSAHTRLVWWLHPQNVAEMATQASDLWAWRGGIYFFLNVALPNVSPLTSFDFPRETRINRTDPEPRRSRVREVRSWFEDTPQPELAYEVVREWGDPAFSFGEFDEARHAHQDIALPVARLHHTAREVLIIKQALATVATKTGDFGGAIEILKDAVEESGRLLGADHPDALSFRSDFAGAYRAAGRPNNAIPLFEGTFITREELLGPNHPHALTNRNNLTATYQDVGRLNDAILLHEETLKALTQLLGPNHPNTLGSRNNLVIAYRATGQLNDAIPLLEETLVAQEQLLGADHPDTLSFRNNLAGAYYAAGRLNEAIFLSRETLIALIQLLGPNHPHTLTSRNNLANVHREVGRLNDTIPLSGETLETRTRILELNHPDTLSSRNNPANAYQAAGQFNNAILLYEEAPEARIRILGPNHPYTFISRSDPATAHYVAGRLNDAIPLFEETLTAQTQLLGPDHPDTLRSCNNLAVARVAAGKPFRSEEQPGIST